jgi:hypothetical protein
MKNRKHWAIIAFIGIIVSFTACNPDDGSKKDSDTITINGTPKVGETITAKSVGDFTGNFIWCLIDTPTISSVGVIVPDKPTEPPYTTYIVDNKCATKYIVARRWSRTEQKDIYSNVLGPVQPAD